MEKEELINSKSETIGVPQIRNLMELGRTMNCILTQDEYVSIAYVYGKAAERMLKENGLESEDTSCN